MCDVVSSKEHVLPMEEEEENNLQRTTPGLTEVFESKPTVII
jgi:hypothetical protein